MYSFPVSSPYRDAGGLGADVSGGILLSDHDGAGVVEGLGVLAGGAVGGVLEGEAVGKGSRGGHEEEGSSGTGSLGGESTVEDGREDGGLRCETGERQRHVPQEAWGNHNAARSPFLNHRDYMRRTLGGEKLPLKAVAGRDGVGEKKIQIRGFLPPELSSTRRRKITIGKKRGIKN